VAVITMRLPFFLLVVVFVVLRLLSLWNGTPTSGGAGTINNHDEEEEERLVGAANPLTSPVEKTNAAVVLEQSTVPPTAPTTEDGDGDEFDYSDRYRDGGVGLSSSSGAAAPSALPFFGHDDDDDVVQRSRRQHNQPPPPPQQAQLKNLRLVFMGDSLTRYQYLSLAYFLRFGRWFDPTIMVNNLVNAHSFHHPFHPKEDWNEFFFQSNRILHPFEVCDCLRSHDGRVVLERRYFYDAKHNNRLTYINMNGKETSPGRGYYGRLEPERIFGPAFVELEHFPFGLDTSGGYNESSIAWDFPTWGDVIRYHVGSLDYDYNNGGQKSGTGPDVRVLLNAGLHPHDFRNVSVASDIQEALTESSLHGVWKTTTYPLQDVIEFQAQLQFSWQSSSSSSTQHQKKIRSPYTRHTDREMCRMIGSCFNVSWTALLRPELFFDDLHFLEPVYRVLNEEYLAQLNLLPQGYIAMDRSAILIDDASRWLP
jgi:hypothetical protein